MRPMMVCPVETASINAAAPPTSSPRLTSQRLTNWRAFTWAAEPKSTCPSQKTAKIVPTLASAVGKRTASTVRPRKGISAAMV